MTTALNDYLLTQYNAAIASPKDTLPEAEIALWQEILGVTTPVNQDMAVAAINSYLSTSYTSYPEAYYAWLQEVLTNGVSLITLIYDDNFTQASGTLVGDTPDTVNLGGYSYTAGASANTLADGVTNATANGTAVPGDIRLQLFDSEMTTGKIIGKASLVTQGVASASNDFHRFGFYAADGKVTIGGYTRATSTVLLSAEGVGNTDTYVAPTPASPNAIYYVSLDLDTGAAALYDGNKSVLLSTTITDPAYLKVQTLGFILGRQNDNKYGRLQVWTGATINDI